MGTKDFKATLKAAVRVSSILPFAAVVAFGQQQINLTAGPATATLPDGSKVPMWGYSCGLTVTGSTATCAALNKGAAAGTWSPVVITVPTGQDLQINLTNHLSFTPATPAGSAPNNIPTSLAIVGQLGGGLGTTATSTPSPAHPTQVTTWPTPNTGPLNTPPPQGPRVQSFSTEVAASATRALTWKAPRPGTYLIESGTHPSIQGPMGLYGMLVVTSAPGAATSGTAYPGVTYDADVPLLLSEIDPVQNNAVNNAVQTAGFSETAVWSGQPGRCGNPSSPNYNTCYPPAVNYSPLYYLFNGVAFNKANAAASMFPASIANPPATGTASGLVLVRFVNAGLRMHVPSIVGSQTGTAVSPAVPPSGFSLIAEDGNPLPGVPRVQSEVFMAAGKTYDVMVNGTAAGAQALPVFDRQLSLSGNAIERDAGMLAYISINGAGLPAAPAIASAVANPDVYASVLPCLAAPCRALTVSDPSKGLIANDVNVYGVKVLTPPTKGTLTLAANGTFTYIPNAGWSGPDSFVYQANGSPLTFATVTLNAAPIEGFGGITINNISYTANTSTFLNIKRPGVLSVDKDAAGYPLTVAMSSVKPGPGVTLTMDPNGGFNASVAAAGTYTFTYRAQNSQGTLSASAATVTLTFPPASNLKVAVLDGMTKTPLPGQDYHWVIEEDKTFYIDPKATTSSGSAIVPTFGVNFHTSNMPLVAQGCTGPLSCQSGQTVFDPTTGRHLPAVCDIGNGACRTTGTQQTAVFPSQVHLDPTKRYYISVLPGDAANPFYGAASVGHTMGGAPITFGQTNVRVLVQPTPLPPGKLSVMVFQDDFPLNGEQDGNNEDNIGIEQGLGGFNIILFDDAGGPGDPTGQMTYDMFNEPLSNSLAGTIDPSTNLDACPIAKRASNDPTQAGITGMIVTCPKYEADGMTLSPLGGQAVIANLMPGRFSVVVTPGADRIAKGEEWLQTNTLDGQKGHDAFIRVGEPSYFQEFGPSGYHVSVGFANPKIINDRLPAICAGATCSNTVTGRITATRMSRTPDERLYSSGSRDTYYFTQCYVSMGDPDGEDFAFAKCDDKGNFTLSGLPDGDWRITVFDQWNDQIVDGLSTPVRLGPANRNVNMGDIPVQQWQSNVYTRTFIDDNKDGVSQVAEAGIPLIPVAVRYRDGSLSNGLNTDFDGIANFNETFPLFNWFVVETDTTRYKTTGTHVVYDAGGPADGTTCGPPYPPCGTSTIGKFLANTIEQVSLPTNLRVPGAVYCKDADCSTHPTGIQGGPASSDPPTSGANYLSTGRIDPPWVGTEGWQGFSGQNNFIEFGKTPYVPGENGGIKGHVVYASTRPFDDPQMLVQTQWEPLVPHVTINLYQEGTAADGSQSLTLVDTTQTSSWDDFVQGFRSDGMPNINCPGQSTSDLFYFSLFNQPNFLNQGTPLPNNSQFKCYDGMHNWNQVQPAPYDGMYKFPSVTGRNPQTGAPAGTNCSICAANPTDGTPMLPTGKYVVEVVPPPGYELVKEEDKNILIGDNFIAPVTQQFAAMSAIFIMPDQAQIASGYNANNAQNPTQSFGASPNNQIVPGFVPEPVWPCVGQARIVPDYISLFPQSKQIAPFAGATRNLCDRKEVTLGDQTSAIAKFFIYTPTHIAAKFTGVITDDFTSEFDPFSPSFGEKFAPPNMPISFKDWTGNEVSRVYSDRWGAYDGMTYSSWEVNPPNPTGYSPTMMVACMNDKGLVPGPNGTLIQDPLFNPGYSQFCYEIPFMPGQTQYMDTPVVPTSAFSEGYNRPDCAYPNATPAISEVDGDGVGPWVSATGHTLTITALGDQTVNNFAYSGPSATTAPYNQKTITRHYGFGATRGTGGVTIGGVAAQITSWSDTQIVAVVPSGVPVCSVQQQARYGGSAARCGELIITAGNGLQSIDTVTVTIGGKAPTRLAAGQTIQSALDAASPGDLIIVPPGTYKEILIMWKPVRLQGVGAASSIVDANTQPAGKLDPWRRQVNCLFGLALNGTPISATNPYDPNSTFTCSSAMQFQVDRLPLEAVVGWDASLNGNLPELLQEPTLMGAYEGAGITVLGKGVKFPAGSNPFGPNAFFPDGTALLTASDCGNGSSANPFPSNFWCNPSRIDALSITDSSQGGGGIFAHGWTHNLEVANNRAYNNTGTLSGGINIGQGEFPPSYLQGNILNLAPGSCQSSPIANTQLPYCFDLNVSVHNNAVTANSSIGDELFSATNAGAGGVTFCTGTDYYKFNSNWVCGNMSAGDGGGVSQMGYVWNGTINNNWILFNQSINPTIPTNGGGIMIMGAPDTDPTCPATATGGDCPPGLADGAGPGLLINANLIMGNAAESGSGGGIRLQGINGTEVTFFPTQPSNWYSVNITNNIISNNVAGWDGAGVSLQDALSVNLINNTIVSNDTTASAGVLFNTLGAPTASSTGPTCTANCGTTSAPQPAGLVTMGNSPPLLAALPATGITCPTNHPNCAQMSYPYLANNVFWQNRSFYIGVGALSPQYQQNIVSLYNSFSGTPAANQPQASATQVNGKGVIISGGTGACTPGASYWDIGVRGDTGPANHASGFTLAPTYSVLTDVVDYPNLNNLGSDPTFVSLYCNGARIPPEFGSAGYQVPPGISDSVVPNPIFNLTPSATVDEGNNWINMSWGPLALTNPILGTGSPLGDYRLATGSPAIDYIPPAAPTFAVAPKTDFFGNPRPSPGGTIDVGAVEFRANSAAALTSIAPATGVIGTNIPVTLTGTNLTGATAVTVSGTGVTVSGITVVDSTTVTATFAILSTAALTARTVTVTTPGGVTNPVTFTVIAVPTLTLIAPATGVLGSSVPVTLTGTNLTGATSVNVSGADIIVSGMTVVSATSVTATFAIPASAALTARTVSVTTPGGTSGNVTFTVVAPTLTSIAPTTGVIGTTAAVTLTGTNLNGATAVNVSGGDITVNNVTVVSATTVTANFLIPATAALTARTVSVTTPGGTTGNVTFTVVAPATPTLTAIAPNTGLTGTNVPVTLTGTNLNGATALNVSDVGVTVSGVTVVSSTTITATFTIAATAPATARTVTVTTLAGTTGSVTFTVIAPPALTSIAPTFGVAPATGSTNVPVTLTGTSLTGTTAVTVSGTGVTVSGITVVNSTTITATFAIASTAALTARNITVTNPIGTSNAVIFTIIGAPTLASIAPTTGLIGTNVAVTLTGANLAGATAVNVSGGDITVTGITATATTVTATFAIPANAALTARTVSVTTPGGTSGNVAFTVVGPPTLTSIAPTTGVTGTNLPVTLTGTYLTGATAVNVSGGDITVSGITVVNATTVTATFAIPANAALTARTVSVTTPNGTTGTVGFTVFAPPTLTAIAPTTGVTSTNVPVTLTGTNLTGATAVNVSGTGVTVSGLTVVNSTTVTATFAIAANAALTGRTVSVTTPGGTSGTVTFTVFAPPTLTSIAPATGVPSFNVPVTLTGTNLTGATAVTVSGADITVSGVTVVNATTVTATFAIPATAALTARTVSVTTPGGTSGTVTFTVVAPTLTSIAPITGAIGTNVPVTLTGTNLTGATAVNVSGGDITVSGITSTATTVTATFAIPATAALTGRTVSVTTPGGTTGNVTFTVVTPPAPTLTSIAPITGLVATNVPVTLTGTNLAGATAVTVSGGDITVTGITSTATTVTATFAIPATAALTARTVSVTTLGGTTGTVTFTVISVPPPTLTSIAPTTGTVGTNVPVTLTGTNLTGATAVTVSGTGVTVSGITVVNATTVTATFAIAANAALTARTVSVTTPGGTSGTVTFTVAQPPPALSSISPTAATHPASGSITVPVTIRGTNLTNATGLFGLTGGVTLVNNTLTVVNPTTITATFNIASSATLGDRNIGVLAQGGSTNTVVFTVH